jgi:AcrR family transcriptional regulator
MSETVKRNYASTLRAEQAKATRRAIVDAAARLFLERGYGDTTIDAIAAAAGVSRKTVFTSVGGKVEALKLARDWAIVGDDDPVPILERPEVTAAYSERDARRVLADYVRTWCAASARVAGIHHVIESAAGLDEDVRALSDENIAQRRFGMGKLAELLGSLGALRDGVTVDIAADVLWFYNDPGTYYRLVITRGWSVDALAAWLGEALTGQLMRPDYLPAEQRS